MTAKKLLSISVISRDLNVPESTLHYWKNRFAEFLPSVGKGRQRRFRPEAVEVFRNIGEMLKMGYTTKDIKAELAGHYPLNVEPQPAGQGPQPQAPAMAQPAEMQAQAAVAIGQEVARVVGEKLGEALNAVCGGDIATLASGVRETRSFLEAHARDVEELRRENAALRQALADLRAEVAGLREPVPAVPSNGTEAVRRENEGLKRKLSLLESELGRLRKDRRDMEKLLLERVRSSLG